ncbi:unnamed protein product [Phaedon cochleariae]|uniref:CREB/ATF bZIP transcription factor n=1 Tax=Phaedon cochleariae TaxID=80249 RepID=A0A9N9X3H2_PHACE|nr:unnamed protein product [Phaedon cochleariae]
MVTNPKRMKYVFDKDEISSEEDSLDDYEDENYQPTQNLRGSGRKPKCFSKNALMARENRLKKKLYVMKLEKEVSSLKVENKSITSVIHRQSQLLTDLKKEVKYLRSVIANSKDIGNLIKSINRSTGMSVSSSVDESLSLKNVCVSKHDIVLRKSTDLWDDENDCPVSPSLKSSPLINSDMLLNEDMGVDFFNDFDVPDSSPISVNEQITNLKQLNALEEHNYTAVDHDGGPDVFEPDDVGVCLHVSKHKVSLEFCTVCSEKALHSWLD